MYTNKKSVINDRELCCNMVWIFCKYLFLYMHIDAYSAFPW